MAEGTGLLNLHTLTRIEGSNPSLSANSIADVLTKLPRKDPKGIRAVSRRRTKFIRNGEMAEWFKAHAWKACVP